LINNRLLAVTLSLVLVAGLASPAFAQQSGAYETAEAGPPDLAASNAANPDDVVYENGVALGNGNSLFIHQNSVANDFTLDDPASITDVHFVLVERSGTTYNNEPIQYAILGDNGGPDPTNVLGSGNAINIEIMNLGPSPLFHDDRLLVWFDFEESVPVDANVKYWLWLHVGDNFVGAPTLGWEGTQAQIGEFARFYPGSDFTGSSFPGIDTWFQLTDKERVVGGDFLPINSTSLLLANAQSFSWMIPVVLSVIGIGLFVVSRKSE